MKKKMLFVSAYIPEKSAKQAGHKTAARNLDVLCEKYEVDALLCGDEILLQDSVKDKLNNVFCCRKDLTAIIYGCFYALGMPLLAASRYHPVKRLVKNKLKDRKYDRIHIEWSQMSFVLDLVSKKGEKTLYIHDVLHQWANRKKKGLLGYFWKIEEMRCKKWESKIYAKYDKLYVPSEKDYRLIADLCNVETIVVPLASDVYVKHFRKKVFEGRLNLMFFGAYNRKENQEAVKWVCRKLLPVFNDLGMDYRFYIIGSNPNEDILRLRNENVEVTGFVEDLSLLFEKIHLAILPLFTGAGVKVKIIESINSKIPVLTNCIGAEGLELYLGKGLFLLSDYEKECIQFVKKCYNDRLFLEEITNLIENFSLNRSDIVRAIL